ncbi:prepilin-type N-terminal cleavage/methylation domain-containing protein [Aeribacillus pallidus]|uniref:prepilin-type N-terminal cleavage/methylation domain-containing protein n=1 Tax=Aeribacillus pallidus TaxID=33936 RepID=UPI000E350DB7|nr:prepilin-type N-terminal cleavage/methylation domain-containing protein [Aeribacillus pallidus]REJ21583.1 MAG: prepilin-type cleavage/methylation domain-containing protein [Bacillaceae bacterium]RZI52717.1 prepilin-type N-terminal cleavage/methylation domain-containing protein [Aeribacillus pallidus]
MRKHVKLLKKEKGMTLIELLAVIIIIAIILAIAIPIIANVIGNSRERANVSEALNIISAAKLKYAQEGGTGLPYDADALEGYIDFETDSEDFEVSFEDNKWKISGHPAVDIADEDNDESATEGELRKYLDNN